jgi:hypothetical protein
VAFHKIPNLHGVDQEGLKIVDRISIMKIFSSRILNVILPMMNTANLTTFGFKINFYPNPSGITSQEAFLVTHYIQKTSKKNPPFEAISLLVPTGPPLIVSSLNFEGSFSWDPLGPLKNRSKNRGAIIA